MTHHKRMYAFSLRERTLHYKTSKIKIKMGEQSNSVKESHQQQKSQQQQRVLQEVDRQSAHPRQQASSSHGAPVVSAQRGGTGSVLFFSSVMKTGGMATVSEFDAQQQLVRSGVVKATQSLLGGTFAKIRAVHRSTKEDKEALAFSSTARDDSWLKQRCDSHHARDAFTVEALTADACDADVAVPRLMPSPYAAAPTKRAREQCLSEPVNEPCVRVQRRRGRHLLDTFSDRE
jgi:hypothetical protein